MPRYPRYQHAIRWMTQGPGEHLVRSENQRRVVPQVAEGSKEYQSQTMSMETWRGCIYHMWRAWNWGFNIGGWEEDNHRLRQHMWKKIWGLGWSRVTEGSYEYRMVSLAEIMNFSYFIRIEATLPPKVCGDHGTCWARWPDSHQRFHRSCNLRSDQSPRDRWKSLGYDVPKLESGGTEIEQL